MSVYEGNGRAEPNRGGSDRMRSGARQAKDQAKEKAHELKDRVMESAERKYDEKKHEATGELHDVARALRTASDELDSNGRRSGRVFSVAAERLEDLAGRFEGRDLDGMLRETQNLARRNPGAFLAGTLALGFIAARFLKASPPLDTWSRDDFEADNEYGYDSSRGRAAGFESDVSPTYAKE